MTATRILACLIAAPLGLVAAISPAASPPARPPVGLTLRMEFVRARDADTIEARVHGSAYIFALRLIDVWAPELTDADARRKLVSESGRDFVTRRCQSAAPLTVFVPLSGSDYPLRALTFDRVLAWVWVGDEKETLNRQVVRAGFASSTRDGGLGE